MTIKTLTFALLLAGFLIGTYFLLVYILKTPNDYKQISRVYFLFGLIAGFIGIALTAHLKLILNSNFSFLPYDSKMINIVITAHAVFTICFFSMGILFCAFPYMLLPSSVLESKNSNSVFFKISLFSLWLSLLSLVLFVVLLILEIFVGGSWELKLPFFNIFLKNREFLLASVYSFALSYFLVSLNFVIRLTPKNIKRFSIFLLTIFEVSQLLLFFLPLFIIVVTMYLLDFDTLVSFFDPIVGSDIFPWSNLFWFSAHPIGYILLLPSLGIVSDIVLNIGKHKTPNHKYIIYCIWLLGGLGYVAWILNLIYLTTFPNIVTFLTIFRIVTIFPICIILINWLYILWNCLIKKDTPYLFAIGYIITLSLGIVTSFVLSLTELKSQQYNIEYITAQFHYFVALVTMFAIFGGFYSCPKKIIKVYYSETLGQIHFWIYFLGANLSFYPGFFCGLPSLQKESTDTTWDTTWGELLDVLTYSSLVGSFLLTVSFFSFFVVLVDAFLSNRAAKKSISRLALLTPSFSGTSLDFVIRMFFSFYFMCFISLSILNNFYWVLFLFCALILGILILNIFPKVGYYFSPLGEVSSTVYFNYKEDWPFVYYPIQIFRIIFLGIMLYLLLQIKTGPIEFIQMAHLSESEEIARLLEPKGNSIYGFSKTTRNILELFNDLVPFFVMSVIFDIGLRSYLASSINDTPGKQNNLKTASKEKGRRFSTIAKTIQVTPRFVTLRKTAAVKIYIGTTIGLGIASIKYTSFDFFDRFPLKLQPSELKNLWEVNYGQGFRIEDPLINQKFASIKSALGVDEAGKAVRKHMGSDKVLTLPVIHAIWLDPEYAEKFSHLSWVEKSTIEPSLLRLIGGEIKDKIFDAGEAMKTKTVDTGNAIITKTVEVGEAMKTKTADTGSAIKTKAQSAWDTIARRSPNGDDDIFPHKPDQDKGPGGVVKKDKK